MKTTENESEIKNNKDENMYTFYGLLCMLQTSAFPADTLRNNDVVITSKRRHLEKAQSDVVLTL